MAIPFRVIVAALVASFSPLPILYCYDIVQPGQAVILTGGFASLIALPFLVKKIIGKNENQGLSSLLQFLSIFLFASVTDLTLSLKVDGYVKGMMDFYLAEGEPYFNTSYGVVICYWDGLVHYAMYWLMLKLYVDKRPIRYIGLYWAGTFIHSLIILLLGNVLGSYEVKTPILLNIPYLVVPMVYAVKLLKEEPPSPHTKSGTTPRSGIMVLADSFFAMFFFLAICVAILRGFAALGSERDLIKHYASFIEPYIFHHTGYPKSQMLIYLFYFVPYYIMALYGLVSPKASLWMVDWSLIHAGAAAQAQIGHILPQFHHMFDAADSFVFVNDLCCIVHWLVNIGLLVIPQLFALRCLLRPDLFFSVKVKKT